MVIHLRRAAFDPSTRADPTTSSELGVMDFSYLTN